MISKKTLHNLLFIILFVFLDIVLIVECYKAMMSSNDDIFEAPIFSFLIDFVFYTPFLTSQLFYLLGINTLLKCQLQVSKQYCILMPTVFSGLIAVGYVIINLLGVFDRKVADIGEFLSILNPAVLLGIAWIGALISPILYVIGVIKKKRIAKSVES